MEKVLTISKDYLLVPVKKEAEKRLLTFWCGTEKIYEFEISCVDTEETYPEDFCAVLPVKKWKGQKIRIEGDVCESLLAAVREKESAVRENSGYIHFVPETGWINDPNGLIYSEGKYHLYFQHNPVDVNWGNMSWGHAESTDLLHWVQKEDVMFPDENGTMFSGCAILNERGLLGLPKDTPVFFYTVAGSASEWSKGKKFVQRIAYSTDQGETLTKIEENVLEHIEADNRDPKVYWHEEKQLYYMVLYLDKNDYAIFNSSDLKNWVMTQKLTIPGAWECPDFREIPVEGGGKKWIFWSADGYYFLGDFDGSHFVTDGVRQEAYHCMLPYAGQTFAGTDRVIMIPWMRTNNQGKNFRGMMGIPRELTLVKTEKGYLLRQKLVQELEEQKVKKLEAVLDSKSDKCVDYTQKEPAAVEIVVKLEEDKDMVVDLYGTKCLYHEGVLKIEGIAQRTEGVAGAAREFTDKEEIKEGQTYRELKMNTIGKPEKLSLLSDGEILEVTVNDGLLSEAYETVLDVRKGEITVQAEGKAKVEIYQIQ